MNVIMRGLVQCGCHCPAGGTTWQVVYHCRSYRRFGHAGHAHGHLPSHDRDFHWEPDSGQLEYQIEWGVCNEITVRFGIPSTSYRGQSILKVVA